MSKTIMGTFESPENAITAVNHLIAKGISNDRISALASEPTAKQSLGIEKQTKGAEGAALGGGIGAATVGIFAGLTTVGAVASGGAGLLVAGPLVSAMAGAGIGAISGGAIGGLIGLGFSEHEVKHFQDALQKGSVLIAVDMDDQDDGDLVKDLLQDQNAKDVSTS